MKKKTIWLISLLLSAALLVLAPPLLLKLDTIHSRFANRLNSELGKEISFDKTSWHWLPLPHLAITNLRTSNDLLDLAVPYTRLHPDWSTMLSERPELGRLVFKDPFVHLKDIFQGPAAGRLLPVTLPQAEIFIENGRLEIDAPRINSDLIKIKPIAMSSIHAAVKLRPQQVSFYLTGSSPASQRLRLQGDFNPVSKAFLASFDFHGLNLGSQLSSLARDKIMPADTVVDLRGQVQGTGLDKLQLEINGDLPGFSLSHKQRDYLFIPGAVDLSFSRSGSSAALNIKKLDLKKPGLVLSGTVSRNVEKENGPPTWNLDLSATDIDLSTVRESVLTLLGDDHIAKTVCDIVLGGSADRAAYAFKGTASDFRRLELMQIKADVASAAIHVPHADLLLSEAGGPIEIINGRLSGKGLRARLDNSRGRNCDLLLDLTGRTRAFNLDLDLEADLAVLPPILKRLVSHKKFIAGLNRLQDVSGRAVGHLSLGDSLDRPAVKVRATDIQARADLVQTGAGGKRLLPVNIAGGSLDLAPGSLSWAGVKGGIAQQSVHEMAGAINWDKDILFSVNRLSADLDAKSLFLELNDSSMLPKKTAGVLSAIDGTLKLTNAALQGPLFRPQDWQFQAELAAGNLLIKSPLLPGELLSKKTAARLSHKEILLAKSTVSFLGQPFTVAGAFKHRQLQDWQGSITMNGVIQDDHAAWIKEKGWIPAPFFPRIPLTLQDLTLTWDKESREIRGTAIPGLSRQALPRLQFDLKSSKDNLLVRKLDFIGRDSHGQLSLILRGRTPARYLYAWEGSVSNDTLNAILANNSLLAGSLAGKFRLEISDQPRATVFDGKAEIRDLRWQWPGSPDSTAGLNLRLNSQGNRVDVEELDFALNNDRLSAKGLILTEPDSIKLILDLTAPTLARENISDFISGLERLKKKISGTSLQPRKFSGRIVFNLDSFRSGKTADETAADQGAVYACSPLNGEIVLQSQNNININFSSSKLCGIDLSGTWYSDKSQGNNSFSLKSNPEQPLLFQDFLPCLGIKQEFIEGPSVLQADLEGADGKWSKGKISIRSSRGQIRRMTMLAKVFSIINIADIFSTGSLPDLTREGFAYSELDIEATVKDNVLVIDKAVIRGEGLNLFGSGSIQLADYDSRITILVAPLKTLDALVNIVPIISGSGKEKALLTIPVGVRGNIKNPTVTVLPPEAVGERFLNLVKETLQLPFSLLSPMMTPDKQAK